MRKILIKISLFCFVLGMFSSCSDLIVEVIEKVEKIEEIEIPFTPNVRLDTILYIKLNKEQKRKILELTEPTSIVTNHAIRSFRVDEPWQISKKSPDSLRITSYSPKPISNVILEIYIDAIKQYLPVAFLDSIPAFSQFEFELSCVKERKEYQLKGNKYISVFLPDLNLDKIKPRIISEDEHFKQLEKIEAKWTIQFSNYDWTPEKGDGAQWRELSAIYAREWIVIMTNYAYMMTTPEYHHIMENFRTVFGGDLNNGTNAVFNAEKYQSEKKRFLNPHTFHCGHTGNSVGGLGGGSTLGITHWNFYGHYASFSGWETITHEFMHCMGYGHQSNMTYAQGGIGWTEFMWQLHTYLRHNKKLPYCDRNLLGFHKPENATYRHGGIDQDKLDDKKIFDFYKKSKVTKYFQNNPLK